MRKFTIGSSLTTVVLLKEQYDISEMHCNFCTLAKVVLCCVSSKDDFYVADAQQKLTKIIMAFILWPVI